MDKNFTTVRSGLARKDAADTTTVRCPSRYQLKKGGSLATHYGTEPLQCTRPRSGHRIHEYNSLQWERGNC
jgi:hypothetical protein